MNNSIALKQTIAFIETFFAGESTGHDLLHSLRVFGMASYLAEKEKSDQLFEIQMAALLHDTDDHKLGGDGHSFPHAEKWLNQLQVPDESKNLILTIISEVSYKGAQTATPVSSLASAIVQDADRLDALGAIGIARAFAYGGKHNRPLYIPGEKAEMHKSFEDYKKSQSSTLAHFPEKLFLLKDRMNTPAAKSLAERKHQYLKDYYDSFLNEANAYENYLPVE